MTGPKIVVIGGGSHQWVPTLVTDAAATPAVADAHLALVDLDGTRLPRMARWVEHVAATRGVGLTVSTSTDRRAALAGADAVVVCISTGGLTTMANDLAVPERYGFRQPVGDTVGPGGISRALRNVPVMAELANDVAELAPGAWIVNITNPMTTLTRTVGKVSEVPVVGLCHEVVIARLWMSLLLDCAADDLSPVIAGVNHLPFAVRLDRRTPAGPTDALAELRALLDDPAELDRELPGWVGDLFRDDLLLPGAISTGVWDPTTPFTKRALAGVHAAKFDLLRTTGALPLAGDRHVVEFFPGFLTEEHGWGARWGVALTTIAQRQAQEDRYVADLEARLARPEVPGHVSMESAMPLIASLLGGAPPCEVPVNVANRGAFGWLHDDAVIESMGTVAAGSITVAPVRDVPVAVQEHLRRLVVSQELTVDAALAGDRELLLAALLADPFAGRIDPRSLAAMADDLVAANSDHLPAFRPAPRSAAEGTPRIGGA